MKQKKSKSFLAILLSLALILPILPTVQVQAATQAGNTTEYYNSNHLKGGYFINYLSTDGSHQIKNATTAPSGTIYLGKTYKYTTKLTDLLTSNTTIKSGSASTTSSNSAAVTIIDSTSFKANAIGSAVVTRYMDGTYNGKSFTNRRFCYITLNVKDVPFSGVTATASATSTQVGGRITFKAGVTQTALGTPTNVKYQWYKTTSTAPYYALIPGATSPTYQTPALTLADNGVKYFCACSNSSNTYQSGYITISVKDIAPVISSTIPSQSSTDIVIGNGTTLQVNATGSNLTYQWTKNGTVINGATSNIYTVPASSSLGSDTYECTVSNSAATKKATFTVNFVDEAPQITSQPTSASKKVGDSATFSVGATGTNLIYTWYKSGSPTPVLTGAGKNVLTVSNLRLNDNNTSYYCEVSNSTDTEKTSTAKLTVTEDAPVITQNPAAVTVKTDTTATFSVAATGTSLKYQWYVASSISGAGTLISGATSKTYTTGKLTTTNSGTYYYCCVSNSKTVYSARALLTVTNEAVVISSHPADASIKVGETATFSVTAGGTNITYQWYKANSATATGTAITNATSATYTVSNRQINDSGTYYYCIVSNEGNTPVPSNRALLTVTNIAPSITSQTGNIIGICESTATFKVEAEGTNNTYQWYKTSSETADGSIIEGATSATYVTPKLTIENSGTYYYCIVSNEGNTPVTSNKSLLTVKDQAMSFITEPSDKTVKVGDTATFLAFSKVGTNNTYQWYKADSKYGEGTAITGATLSLLTIENVTYEDNGTYYYCVCSNTGNTKTSRSGKLTVNNVPPVITSINLAVSVKDGEEATYKVEAEGTNNIYQWYELASLDGEGVAIEGATEDTYSFQASYEKNGYYYYCVVSNEGNTPVRSDKSLLTVSNVVPKITEQPSSQKTMTNGTVLFRVMAEGTNLKYQWYQADSSYIGGTAIEGATSDTYEMTAYRKYNQTFYYCEVSNDGNPTVISSRALLDIYSEITLNGNGGTVTPEKINVTLDAPFDDLPQPKAEGKVFNGWYSEADGGIKITSRTKNIYEEGTTLYAHWVETDQFVTGNILYTVTDEEKKEVQAQYAYDSHPNFGTGQQNNETLNNIEIPETVKNNGEEYTVTSLAPNCFDNCDYIYTVQLPETITSIGDYAFYNCEKLNSVTMRENITEIGVCAFSDCPSLRSVSIPDGVTVLSEKLFQNCPALAEVKLPENLENIQDYVFCNCVKLTAIEIPQSVNRIGAHVFDGCTELAGIELPYALTDLGEAALKNCKALKSVSVPQGIIGIRAETFQGCENISTITISDSVESIAAEAFADCVKLSNFVMPSGIFVLGSNAFSNCQSLAEIIIPESLSLEGLGEKVFSGAIITSCYVYAENPEFTKKLFEGATIKNLYIHGEVLNEYEDSFEGAEINDSAVFYTVTFLYEDGTGTTTSIKNVEGKQITLPLVTRKGYTLKGWSLTTSSNSIQYEPNSAQSFSEDTTLYAVWETDTYVLTFNNGTGNSSTKPISYGSTYGDLPTPEKKGYTFVGWFTDPTAGTEVTTETLVLETADVTLYAHWKPETYTATFDGNGGTSTVQSRLINYESKIGILPTASRTGYSFDGWYTDPVAGEMIDENMVITQTNDIILYAHWTANKYQVTFNTNGGDASLDAKEVTFDQEYGELPTASRTGYTFAGWFTDPTAGTVVLENTKVTTTTAVVLYAHWTSATFTATFDANGGVSSVESRKIIYESAYGILPTASRTGYSFDGWYTDPTAGVLIEETTIYNTMEDVTLYAHWTANKYQVSFNGNGGKASLGAKEVTFDQEYGELPTASRTGYSFDGWYTDPTAGVQVKKSTPVTNADNHTLYAHWTMIKATGISISETKATIYIGGTKTLAIKTNPSSAASNVTWTSSNNAICSIDQNGIVTGKKEGAAIITGKENNSGLTKTCLVTVKFTENHVITYKKATKKKLANVNIVWGSTTKTKKKTVTLKKGKKMTITNSKYSYSVAKKKVTYTSSNKKIVKVTKNGKVTAMKKGTVTITIKAKTGAIIKLKIKVK